MFEVIPKKCPISIEVKDTECSELACQKMIELLRKYDRFETTVIGGYSNALNEMLLKMDSRVALFCSAWDVAKILLCYFTGLLPYLDIQREAFQTSYMSKNFIEMKYAEREAAGSLFTKIFLTLHIYLGQVFDFMCTPCFVHLQRRGMFTCYWVINEKVDCISALSSGVMGIMTDKPNLLKNMLLKQRMRPEPPSPAGPGAQKPQP